MRSRVVAVSSGVLCAVALVWKISGMGYAGFALGGCLAVLVVGICLHNFLDGWSTQLASATAGNLGIGMLVGNLIHKAPESIVLGILLRSAMERPSTRPFWQRSRASSW